jgi:hypothetical protein
MYYIKSESDNDTIQIAYVRYFDWELSAEEVRQLYEGKPVRKRMGRLQVARLVLVGVFAWMAVSAAWLFDAQYPTIAFGCTLLALLAMSAYFVCRKLDKRWR